MDIEELFKAEQRRVDRVNEFIQVVASCGCRLFHHEGFVSSFYLSDAESVFFIDCISKERIYTHRTNGGWKGFELGFLLRRFVESLRDFIKTGRRLSLSYFSADWGCDIDSPWDYGDDLQVVRDAALRLGLAR